MVTEKVLKEKLTFKPLTINESPDFLLLFEEPGPQQGCWCMYLRIKREDCHHQFGEGNKLAYLTWILVGLLAMSVLVFYRRAWLEEVTLAERFGDQWRSYEDRSRFIIPFIY